MAVTDASGFTVSGSSTYALADKSNGVGFYQCKSGLVIPAGKAYLPVATGSREVILIGGTTGMSDAARLIGSEEANSELYNLQGQRVSAPRKGVYIIRSKRGSNNGKTVIK